MTFRSPESERVAHPAEPDAADRICDRGSHNQTHDQRDAPVDGDRSLGVPSERDQTRKRDGGE